MAPSAVDTTPPHTLVFHAAATDRHAHSPSSAHILGIGTAYPDKILLPEGLEEFATKWCEPSESLSKTLMVNNHTQINKRPLVQDISDPLLNQEEPPKIRDVNKVFMEKGVELALKAAKKALADWGGNLEDITHLVCNTCTASSYPGYDHAVLMALGLPLSTDRTLLHGVGCAGGLSLVRLAHQLARVPADSPTSKPNRVLIISAEVTSTLCRSEIDELSKASKAEGGDPGWPNVSLCLFSDGASAMVVGSTDSRGLLESHEHSSFEILDCITETVPETVEDLGFNVDEYGWKAIISQRVPKLTSQAVPQLYNRLLSKSSLALRAKVSKDLSFVASPPSGTQPRTLDWMIHPGGSLIISKIEKELGLSCEDHTQASWNIYQNNGNTSSVSIGAVIERSREIQSREGCVAVAFGPGVTVEMCLLRRTGWKGAMVEANARAAETSRETGSKGGQGLGVDDDWKRNETPIKQSLKRKAREYVDLGIHEATAVPSKDSSTLEHRLKRKPDNDLAEDMVSAKRPRGVEADSSDVEAINTKAA
ncbi:hypothetical protein NliqN6_1696 [Naganishia liquefaciens]|uniref:Type III polyketide synthase n=1 Tax=Naganishia liquefaciens TaxID=104408 RepID=A0A8H3TS81_9TREE|nr:hypothetical protein NliqN6_1696 [Naganishia liquefaciens]